jgi:rhodanese-related sulfurtransferase
MKTLKELIEETKKAVREITVDEARAILHQGASLFLDVREPAEHGEGIVRGAVCIPRGLLELQIEKLVPDRNQGMVVYCAGGIRSALAAKSLQDMGYRNVKSMAGGYTVWEAADYETEIPARDAEG